MNARLVFGSLALVVAGSVVGSVAGCKGHPAGTAPSEDDTALAVERVDDDIDVLVSFKDQEHASVSVEPVDGHTQRYITFFQPAHTPVAQARAAADALVKEQVKLPAGVHMAWSIVTANEYATVLRSYLLRGPALVTSRDVEGAAPGTDKETGEPIVSVKLSASAARRVEQVTTDQKGKRLAILVAGMVRVAPLVRAPIADGRLVVTLGKDASPEEANALATSFRPAPPK